MAYTLHKKWAHRTIRKVFPQVGQTKLEYGWNGRIAMTVDHIPRFHLFDNAMGLPAITDEELGLGQYLANCWLNIF